MSDTQNYKTGSGVDLQLQNVGGGVFADTIVGKGYRSAVDITRPSNTTAYTAGDVIGIADAGTPANAGSAIITFASVGPSGGHALITSADLMIALSAVPSGMTSFRLHLYTAAPDAILDNAAWDLASSGDRIKYVGYIDFDTPVDLGSTLFTQKDAINKHVQLAADSTSLYGLLQTTAGYTPASGTVYSVKLRTMAA